MLSSPRIWGCSWATSRCRAPQQGVCFALNRNSRDANKKFAKKSSGHGVNPAQQPPAPISTSPAQSTTGGSSSNNANKPPAQIQAGPGRPRRAGPVQQGSQTEADLSRAIISAQSWQQLYELFYQHPLLPTPQQCYDILLKLGSFLQLVAPSSSSSSSSSGSLADSSSIEALVTSSWEFPPLAEASASYYDPADSGSRSVDGLEAADRARAAVLVQDLLQGIQGRLHSFSPPELLQLLEGLLPLQQLPSNLWLHAWETGISPGLKKMGPGDLVRAAAMLMVCQYCPTKPWAGLWLVAFQAHIPDASPTELLVASRVLKLWGCRAPTPAWAESYLQTVQQQMPGMATQQLLAAADAALLLGGQPSLTPQWLFTFQEVVQQQDLHSLTPSEMVQLLQSLILLRVQPSLQWLQQYLEAVQRKLYAWNDVSQLGTMLIALASLSDGATALRLHDTSRASSSAARMPEEWGGSTAAVVNVQTHDGLLGKIVSHTVPLFRHADPGALLQLLRGFAVLGYMPERDWVNLLLDKAAAKISASSAAVLEQQHQQQDERGDQIAAQQLSKTGARQPSWRQPDSSSSSSRGSGSSNNAVSTDTSMTPTSSSFSGNVSASGSAIRPGTGGTGKETTKPLEPASSNKRIAAGPDARSNLPGVIYSPYDNTTPPLSGSLSGGAAAEDDGVDGTPRDPTQGPGWDRYKFITGGIAGWPMGNSSGSVGGGNSRPVRNNGSTNSNNILSSNKPWQPRRRLQPRATTDTFFARLLDSKASLRESLSRPVKDGQLGLRSLSESSTIVQQVVDLLAVVVVMRLQVEQEWLDVILGALRGHFRAVQLEEMQSLLASLDSLGGVTPEDDSDWLNQLLNEAHIDYAQLQPRYQLRLLQLLATTQTQPTHLWWQEFMVALQGSFEAYTAYQLILLLAPLCEMGGQPPQAWLTDHEACILAKARDFNNESWLLLLVFYSELMYIPSRRFQAAVEQYFLGALPALGPSELACLLSCSGRLQLSHNPQLEERIVARIEQVLPSASPSEVQQLLQGLLLIEAHVPSPCLRSLCELVQDELSFLSPHATCCLLQLMAASGTSPDAAWLAVALDAIKSQLHLLDPMVSLQLLQTLKVLQLRYEMMPQDFVLAFQQRLVDLAPVFNSLGALTAVQGLSKQVLTAPGTGRGPLQETSEQ